MLDMIFLIIHQLAGMTFNNKKIIRSRNQKAIYGDSRSVLYNFE